MYPNGSYREFRAIQYIYYYAEAAKWQMQMQTNAREWKYKIRLK